MLRYGLDFGTTNSSICLSQGGDSSLIPVDKAASDPRVIPSALYFFRRNLVYNKNVSEAQKQKQEFDIDQIKWEGEMKYLIGTEAVSRYLSDHKHRNPGILRKIYTGKLIELILWNDPYSGKVHKGKIPEVLEELDFGTGRLMHALKSALRSPFYKGTNIFGKYMTLEEMIGFFLSKIRKAANSEVGEEIDAVTVGRPVHFHSDPSRDKAAENRLLDGVKMAGFKDIKFEYEPVGAAKYFLNKFGLKSQKILVFDFGGGTLDTTIMDWDNLVLGTDGVYVGGDLLNSDIFEAKLSEYFGKNVTCGNAKFTVPVHIFEQLKSWYGIINLNSPSEIGVLEEVKRSCSDAGAIERLIYLIRTNLGFEIYQAIENAKKNLSQQESARIVFSDGPINVDLEITRAEYEELISPRIEEAKKTVERTLRSAGLEPEQIGAVVRTGGSSLMPIVQRMLEEMFGREKVQMFDPFTSIAAGFAF